MKLKIINLKPTQNVVESVFLWEQPKTKKNRNNQ